MTDETQDSTPVAFDEGSELISAERLIFFSDAVVAIAITLLALELPLPHLFNNESDRQLWRYLEHSGDLYAYLAFLISFVVIGGHWRSHHGLFRNVSKLDPRIITLNLIWLFTVVITPYATRVLSGNGAFSARFSFYAAIQVLTVLSFLFMARHIRNHGLLRPGTAAPDSDNDLVLVTIAAVFLISIPLSFAVRDWAFVCWGASGLVTKAERAIRGRFRRWRRPSA